MRYLRLITIIVALGMCVFTLHSGISQAATFSVYQSKHDLSWGGGSSFKFKTFQVCVFCHAPHGSGTNVRGDSEISAAPYTGPYSGSAQPMLLWNRALSNANEWGGYEVYSSSSLDVDNGQVRAMSLLCLSCHDGIGALNVLTSAPSDMIDTNPLDGNPDIVSGTLDQIGDVPSGIGNNEPTPINIGGRITFGSGDDGIVHLTDDHPISFDYTTGIEGVYDPSGNTVGTNNLPLFYNPSTGNYSMECSTCHDVHDQGSPGVGDYPFLTMTNDGSQMCLNCHNK